MKVKKLNLDKLINVINYCDVHTDYLINNGGEEPIRFDFNDCVEKGLNESEFPKTFKDFKRYGRPLSEKVLWAYDSDEVNATYFFDDVYKSITIMSDNFTMKECITIINLIGEHLKNVGAGQFISYGMDKDDEHILWHEESTAFGNWWNDFIDFYMDKLKSHSKFSTIEIFTDDYQTDKEGMAVKDRVINILFS